MNGRYTERGIKGRHGYASERYRIHPEYLVAVDPVLGILGVLLEPTTVVAKAWDHIEKIGHRASWAPEKVLITGAGPIGLLAALLATQRGYQTYVLDRVTEGRKPEMVRRLGATYFHVGDLGEAAAEADIVIECTGFVQMLLEAGPQHVRHRITCLTGVSRPAPRPPSTRDSSTATSSCRTPSCSARSTPTGTTTNSPPRLSPKPIQAGSPTSSPARCRSTSGATPTPADRTTSRPSSAFRTHHSSCDLATRADLARALRAA